MEAWLQSLAVGVAVLAGLVSPASDLRVDAAALRGPKTVDLHAEVAGAVTPEAEEYLLAGNALTLVFEVQWEPVRRTVTRSVEYRAWAGEFVVSGDGGPAVTTKDPSAAYAAWRTVDRSPLGTFADLGPCLGRPLTVRVFLRPGAGAGSEGTVRALWGYKVPETSLLYRSWLELPL